MADKIEKRLVGTNSWLLAFDRETGELVDAVSCPKEQVVGRTKCFEANGCRVEVMTGAEVDEYIARSEK